MGAQDPYAQNLMGQAQGGYLGSNPYLNQVYDTSARKSNESFTQNIMPSIKVGAQGAGMGASSRNAMAQGQAAGMQIDNAGNMKTLGTQTASSAPTP